MTEIIYILLHLGGLVLGNALGTFLAAKETLEDVIRTPGGRARGVGFEKLLAQRPAAESVDGLHLIEQRLSRFEQRIKIGFHALIVSI